MLCEPCKTAVEALLSDRDRNHVKFHYNLRSFYDSVRIGCMACRQLWYHVARGVNHFQEFETIEEIPQSYDLFELHISDLHERRRSLNETIRRDYPDVWMGNMFTQEFTNVFTSKSQDIGNCVVYVQRDSGEKMTLFYNSDLYLMDFDKSCSFMFHPLENSQDPHTSEVNFDVQGRTTAAMPQLWRGWLRDCIHRHSLCDSSAKQSSFNPRRLVEIHEDSTGSELKWKIVETADQQAVSYLTLSHCWGKSEHLKLTSSTYNMLQQASNCSILPQTYRDAAQVTFELGYRYLWIDSLCIIQGDANDWKEQSVLMGSIYNNAECNIAAMVAKDSTAGCFGARDPSVLSATAVSWTQGQEDVKRYAMSTDSTSPSNSWLTPLTRRAWVTPERYLARRQLCFLGNQVYWECNELIACEQQPRGLLHPDHWVTSHGLPRKPSLICDSQEKVREAWYELIESYSACDLTFASDKAIALSGLVAQIQLQTSDEYLAGLWKRDLLRQLCWRALRGVPWIDRYRLSDHGSPTWSWISLQAEVYMSPHYDYEDRRHFFVSECVDVTLRSEDSTKLYDFSGSELTLRGLGGWVRVSRAPSSSRVQSWPQQCIAEVQVDDEGNVPFSLGDNNRLSVYWDEDTAMDDDSFDRLSKTQTGNSDLLIMFVTVCYAASRCWGPKILGGDNKANMSTAKPETSEVGSDAELSTCGSEASERDEYADRAEVGADWIEGLLLWRSDGRDGKGSFQRVGVAFAGMQTVSIGQCLYDEGSLISIMEERLGLEPGMPPTSEINLTDERLSDLVHIANIV